MDKHAYAYGLQARKGLNLPPSVFPSVCLIVGMISRSNYRQRSHDHECEISVQRPVSSAGQGVRIVINKSDVQHNNSGRGSISLIVAKQAGDGKGDCTSTTLRTQLTWQDHALTGEAFAESFNEKQ